MGLYGAEPEIPFRRFNGVCFDVDPAELEDGLAGDCQNVDFDGETLKVRRGRTAYNSSAPTASRVWGAHAVYPPDGSTRKLLMQAGTAIYEDNGSGTFSSAVGGLTGGAPMEFVPFKDATYAGNGVDGVRKRDRSGSWSAVTLQSAPAFATSIPVAGAQAVLESFDSASWTLTGSNIAASSDTSLQVEGTGCLKLTFSSGARGSSMKKAWSSGATVDLSTVENLIVWYYSERIGITFQVGVMDNSALSGGVNFALFPTFTTQQKETWVPIRIPLSGIPPASRTASTGLAIKFIDKPSNAGFPVAMYFDRGMAEGPFAPDTYRYRLTDGTSTTTNGVASFTAESNPSDERTLTVAEVGAQSKNGGSPGLPVAGITVTPGAAASGDTLGIYRYRDQGPFRAARLVGTMPAGTTTLNGAIGSTTATSLVVTAGTGFSPGNILTIDTEQMRVTAVSSSGTTLTVTRGFNGTTAATHANGALVTTGSHLDTLSDGALSLADPPELVSGKIVPPLAAAYAAVNGRLLAGNVLLSGVRYPYRVYVSQLDFPENFASVLQTAASVNDPTVAGWFDLPEKDTVKRIVEFDGMAVIFCDRSIWTLQGSGWDDFNVQKRADVGLDARWAVAPWERLIFFLAADGVRVLAPNRSFAGLFETWLISEPVGSRLRAVPKGVRPDCALGMDELGRLHCAIVRSGQTVSDAALVFDPRQQGALEPGYNPKRPGWSYYTGWGAAAFVSLKRGGGDAGQLLAADPATAKLRYLQRDAADADLLTDDGSAIAWSWTSRVLDAGPGAKLAWSYLDSQWDAQPGAVVTATPVLDGGAGTDTKSLTLPAAGTGYVSPVGQPPRFAAGTRAQRVAVQLSGSHSVAMKLRALTLGLFRRP